jgi:hypothetical protein
MQRSQECTPRYGSSLESKMKQKENQFRERRSYVATWYPAYLVSCFVSVVYSRERVVVLWNAVSTILWSL